MSPIYSYLGAQMRRVCHICGWLACNRFGGTAYRRRDGDKTISRWGRRTPYFLIGAILCSLGLLAMPYGPTLWMAASLLWILDAANNITMEPYRAYVSDRLDSAQHSLGF